MHEPDDTDMTPGEFDRAFAIGTPVRVSNTTSPMTVVGTPTTSVAAPGAVVRPQPLNRVGCAPADTKA